jgi:carboxypeptidase Q
MRTLFVAFSLFLCVPVVSAQGTAQPVSERLDLKTISRIRQEGLLHSHVMEYASALADGMGARLTGSPEFDHAALWAVAQLKAIGVTRAYEEAWGDFGMSWTQVGTSLWLTEPTTATFSAQATAWSPATPGEIQTSVVLVPELTDEASFAAWRGKLKGKVILYGTAPPVVGSPEAAVFQVDQAWLDARKRYPLRSRNANQENAEFIRMLNFDEKVCRFFAQEGAVAILRTRGEAATYVDDTSVTMGWFVYQPQHRQALPSAVIAPDAYGRMARLVARGVPVSVRLDIQTKFGSEHVQGMNVLGEIAGVDPRLKDQVVMMGGHLDSWGGATGAADDGAGVVIALEAIRILTSLGLKPRRTIRIGLWGGEEEGTYGSLGYVNTHLAALEYSKAPEMRELPPNFQTPIAITPKPDFANFDVYFNLDNGDGRLLGINAENSLEAAQLFTQWTTTVSDLGFTAVSLRHSEDTDHASFDMVGLPGFQFLQDPRQDSRTHHTNLDTYERLSEPDLKQAATVLAIFIWNAAQQDTMFPRKSTLPAGNR